MKSMFSWGDTGVVQFDGQLPSQTMIDIVGSVPNYHVLRASNNFTSSFSSGSTGVWNWLDRKFGIVHHMHMSQGKEFRTQRDSDSQFVQVPIEASKQRLRNLADQCVSGIEPGWNQIEAIVSHLREEYSVDPGTVPPEDCENAVDHFLDVKSGPGYLFATTASQMLRAAGYKTRLATGFLVKQDDFVRQAGQSIVADENVHVWPEVCIDNCHWIPLEPTPGLPIPFNTETIGQMLKRKIAETIALIFANPITSAAILLIVILLVRLRHEIVARVWWLYWFIVFNVFARRRLKVTRQLIDARFRVAGLPRPPSETIVSWFAQVDTNAKRDFFAYWLEENFGGIRHEENSRPVSDACWRIVKDLTLGKITKHVLQKQLKTSQP